MNFPKTLKITGIFLLFAALAVGAYVVGVRMGQAGQATTVSASAPQEREFLMLTRVVQLMDPDKPFKDRGKLVMHAHRHVFDPSTITVFAGDTVILRVHSLDHTENGHDVEIPDFGASSSGTELLNHKGEVIGKVPEDGIFVAGQEIRMRFVADQAGIFPIYCTLHDEAYEDDGGNDDDDGDGIPGEPKGGPMVAYLVVLPRR